MSGPRSEANCQAGTTAAMLNVKLKDYSSCVTHTRENVYLASSNSFEISWAVVGVGCTHTKP